VRKQPPAISADLCVFKAYSKYTSAPFDERGAEGTVGGHCEPFAFCHSERSEESLFASLRVSSVKQSHEIATPTCRNAPRALGGPACQALRRAGTSLRFSQ
jgi:hypothetical protein